MLDITQRDKGLGKTWTPAGNALSSRIRNTGWMVLASLLLTGVLQAGGFRPELPYPGQVALSKEPRGYVFRRFPGNLPLYISEADKDGQSACNLGCDTTHVPVYAPADAQPIGEWTVIVRKDGRSQWTYRGQPVYTYFHDSADAPAGEGDGWHLLPYET